MPTVYVSIGNSDDKLSQSAWSGFHEEVEEVIQRAASAVHGSWVSPSTSQWQNACWCFEVTADPDLDICKRRWLRNRLENLAKAYGQDSIAWAETPKTEFLCAG